MSYRSEKYKLCCILSLMILSIYSAMVWGSPVIGIGSMYDILTPKEQSATKRIYNSGTSTAFVRVDLLEINPSADDKERELPQAEIGPGGLNSERLIVTPLRLIIPPSGFQSVRILYTGTREKERYFRIRFTPVLPEVNDGFNMNESAIKEYSEESLKVGVNVLTGYGSVMIVQPSEPYFNSQIDVSKDNLIYVNNKGNATITLDDIRYCKAVNTDCGDISREIILPERTFKLHKKPGLKTNFTLIEGDSSKALSY